MVYFDPNPDRPVSHSGAPSAGQVASRQCGDWLATRRRGINHRACRDLHSTGLPYLFHLLATAGAVNTALATLLLPASAIFLGATFLDEQLHAHHYLGMLLGASGLLTVNGRVLGRKTIV